MASPRLTRLAAGLPLLSLLASASPVLTANAADAPDANQAAPSTPDAAASALRPTPAPLLKPDSPYTFHGVTLYGIVDIGVSHLSHGNPRSDDWGQGVNFGISPASNQQTDNAIANGLSQSRIGARGNWALTDDLAATALLETRFNPLSLNLPNGPKSLVAANGVATGNQITSGTSSQAGSWFSSGATVGLSSKTWGDLTFGRQNGLLYDQVVAYDPQGGAYAYSLIGFSSTAAGGGLGDYNRFSNALRYSNSVASAWGKWHGAAEVAPGDSQIGGSAFQLNAGWSAGTWATDLTFASKKNAIALATYGVPSTAQRNALTAEGLTLNNALKATISDTRALALTVRHDIGDLSLYGGFENIVFSSPDLGSADVAIGAATLGGYYIGSLTTNAYTTARVLHVGWAGFRYPLTPELSLRAGAYRYQQGAYATGANAGCASTVNSGCSGTENAWSAVLDYTLNPTVDLYGGVFVSRVNGGIANGYLYTGNVATTTGVRVRF